MLKRLLVATLLRLSKSRTARRLFFLLPISWRLWLRSSASSPITPKSEGSRNFPRISRKINQSGDVWLSNVKENLEWNSVGFRAQVGDAGFVEVPLETGTFKLITLDFWDTLVGRVRPAEGAKRLTALRYALLEWKSRGYSGTRLTAESLHGLRNESESKQVSVSGEAQIQIAIAAMATRDPLSSALAAELSIAEIQDEATYTRALVGVTENPFLDGRDVEIISDFYMSSEALQKILDEKKINFGAVQIHSSADYLLTKRDGGALFSILDPQEHGGWLHVGDSRHSDGEMAIQAGAKSCLVERTGISSWNLNDLSVRELASDLQAHFATDSAGRFLLDLSVVGSSLVTFAVEKAIGRGRSQILYLSREGETLAKIHEFMQPMFDSLGLPKVTPIFIPCSRASVFFPSFADDVRAGFAQLGLQYPVINREALIDTLSLPKLLAETIRLRFSRFQRIRTSSVLSQLNPEIVFEIEQHLFEQRELFRQLLQDLNVDADDAVVCDLGWRGTINDSISRILELEVPGAYLGLNNPLDLKTRLRDKVGLLFDETRGIPAPTYLSFLGPIERAFTVSAASVISYRRNGQRIEPIYSGNLDPANAGRKALMETHLQPAVEEATKALISCGFFGSETKSFLEHIVEGWMLRPNAHHSATWFDESHGEGFGTHEVHYSNIMPQPEWFEDGGEKLVSGAIHSSLWAEGFFSWPEIARFLNDKES